MIPASGDEEVRVEPRVVALVIVIAMYSIR